MFSLVDSMTGPVIRSWHFRLPNPSRGRREEVHKIQLRHYPLTGQSNVTVDGVEVDAMQGVPRTKGSCTLQIQVGTHDCCVGYRAAPRPGRYYYSLVVDGVVVPELNETVGDGGETDADSIPRPTDVFVDEVGSAKDSFGSEFLEFRVVTRRGGRIRRAFLGGIRGPNHGGSDSNGNFGGIEARRNNSSSGGSGESFAVVWRRFTAFRQLHYDITAVLRGSHHMIESLPPLPAKCVNPLVNQMGAPFVETRKAGLQAYLRKILEVPKARTSVNMMGFLGLHPVTGAPLPWAAISPSTTTPSVSGSSSSSSGTDPHQQPQQKATVWSEEASTAATPAASAVTAQEKRRAILGSASGVSGVGR